MKTNAELHAEIPPQADIEFFLKTYFKTTMETHTIGKIVEAVANHFGVSAEAVNLPLDELGRTGHGNTGTFLDSITGFAVMELHKDNLLKRVGPNTYENPLGPDKIMVDSPQIRASLTRKGVSEVIPSVKILKTLTKFANDRAALKFELLNSPTAKGRGWTEDVIELAISHVESLTT